MSLPLPRPDALQLFVFGPGTGELVVVRAPPGCWLVVDGCGVGRTLYGPRFLSDMKAKPNIVVLTHPHRDHYIGLQQVIDDATQGPQDDWPLLGLVTPPEAETYTGDLSDFVAYLANGGAESVVSAIRDRWEREPRTRWSLQPGGTKPFGDAVLRVLAPSTPTRNAAQRAYEETRSFGLNDLSCALAVEWNGHCLVLGSDLVETPGRGWSTAMRLTAKLDEHRALKVPHHGSLEALHEPLLNRQGMADRPWLVTPFASQDLPRFDVGGGAEMLLRHASAFELTSLPRPHATQAGFASARTIAELRPNGRHLVLDPPTTGYPDCWVALELAPDGNATITRGPGAVRVSR